MHLAVTAAILPANAQQPVTQRDAKKSQALLQEAIALLGDNKPDQAAAKLAAAVQADDQNIGAWKEWTAMTAKTRQDEALALARRWVAAMPKSYQARNALGTLLEKQGKLREAMEQYTLSLQIEWNQPPTVEAKTRLEKALQKSP